MRALILASALLAAGCEPVREAPDIADAPGTEATTVFIANDAERRRLIARAESGDGASAYILAQDTPDPEGDRWLERAVQLGWPHAKRDKAVRILKEDPCRLGEARALLAEFRAASTVPGPENAYLDRLVAGAEAEQGAC